VYEIWVQATTTVPVSYSSCLEALSKNKGSKSGTFRIKDPKSGATDTKCLEVNGKVYTMVARVSSSDTKWTYGEDTSGNDNSHAPWENAAIFGTIAGTASFKSSLYNHLPANEMLVRKGSKNVLLSSGKCLKGKSVKGFFSSLHWTCGGSQRFPHSCANACTNDRSVGKFNDNLLNKHGSSTHIYFHAGEANGQQEANEDRSYIVGSSSRPGVDEPSGLGSYCTGGCAGASGSNNIGIPGHDGTKSPGAGYVYEIWVQATV
jgi:hypothetical protein